MWARARIAILWVGALIGLGLVVLLAGLAWAHSEIRSLHPGLPSVTDVMGLTTSASPSADLPVRLWYVNTASQKSTRAGVLEPDLDPDPNAPYTMSVPSFAVEWPDGRIFLVDLGMERDAAVAFGAPSELLFGVPPMEAKGSIAEQLGGATARVAGVAVTHLHTDHTNGAISLCAAEDREIPLFQGSLQAEHGNYTTRPAVDHIDEGGCLVSNVIEGEGLLPVSGFDGLTMIPIAGHTPGSQVFVVRMAPEAGGRTWVLTGDAVNHVDGVRLNLPKPTLYSLLVVPENPTQLEAVRVMLAEASKLPGVELLVSHHQQQLEESGVSHWRGARTR